MKRVPKATADFESRSALKLRTSGTWRYSVDPSTDILCMAFRLPHWEKGRTGLWHPAYKHLGITEPEDFSDMAEFVQWIADGELVEAHNVWFERCIWQNILTPRYGWPVMSEIQWRCSAAKASAHALPRGLDDAASALHLKLRKDPEGAKLIKRLSSPRKSRKAERERWAKDGTTPPTVLWHESKEEFERFWAYCRQDVLTEEAVSEALDDLSPYETRVFLMDATINQRGFQLDEDAVSTALWMLDAESEILNAELSQVTNGYVDKATQRDNMKVWFASEGLDLDDTQAATLDAVLKRKDLKPHVHRAVELMRALGRSSTAKYEAMQHHADPNDWRVRGGLLYHGASTGRWSGSGVQPHNFPKLSPKPHNQKDPDPQDIERLWETLKEEDRHALTVKYGGVMEALSAGLRGAIIAPPGRQLYVADFAGIEARVLLWAAGCEEGLQLFRDHADIYCDMASAIYRRPITKADAKERGVGKIAILGLGYQMGASKFVDTCEKGGVIIPEDVYCEDCGYPLKGHDKQNHSFEGDTDEMTAVKVVDAYRAKYWQVKQLWNDQESSAIAAVTSRAPVQCGVVRWVYRAPFLFCELPSGRRLAYMEPRVKETMMPWGKTKAVLSFMAMDSYVHQWRRQTVYGGLIVENIVQAIARDLMADAMLRIEATGIYQVVLTVHDEIIAEADDLAGSVQEFERLMAQTPDWADGCPVVAEGWAGKRYRK